MKESLLNIKLKKGKKNCDFSFNVMFAIIYDLLHCLTSAAVRHRQVV